MRPAWSGRSPGHEALVWAAGMTATRRAVNLFSRGTQFQLASMGRHVAHRLVCVSASGGGRGWPRKGNLYRRIVFPTFDQLMLDDHSRQLAQIRASALDWTIVGPASLRDGPATGSYHVLAATTRTGHGTSRGRMSRRSSWPIWPETPIDTRRSR